MSGSIEQLCMARLDTSKSALFVERSTSFSLEQVACAILRLLHSKAKFSQLAGDHFPFSGTEAVSPNVPAQLADMVGIDPVMRTLHAWQLTYPPLTTKEDQELALVLRGLDLGRLEMLGHMCNRILQFVLKDATRLVTLARHSLGEIAKTHLTIKPEDIELLKEFPLEKIATITRLICESYNDHSFVYRDTSPSNVSKLPSAAKEQLKQVEKELLDEKDTEKAIAAHAFIQELLEQLTSADVKTWTEARSLSFLEVLQQHFKGPLGQKLRQPEFARLIPEDVSPASFVTLMRFLHRIATSLSILKVQPHWKTQREEQEQEDKKYVELVPNADEGPFAGLEVVITNTASQRRKYKS